MDKKDRPAGPGGKTREELLMSASIRTEKELQEQVANLLLLRGYKFNVDRMDKKRTGTVGWPDFTFSHEGKSCAFECKKQGEQLSAEQVQLHKEMKASPNGWRIAVITNVFEAKSFLDAIQKGSV
jgi:hypothetical protein